MKTTLPRLSVCASLALLSCGFANAQTIQWGNTGATDWNTGSNWDGGTVPGSTNTVQLFNTGTGGVNLYTIPVVDGSFGVLGLSYRVGNSSGTPNQTNITINRGAGTSQLTIGTGGISNADSNTVLGLTINPDVVVGASQTWNSANNAIVINGAISGASGVTLTRTGGSTLTLAGSITNFTGNIQNNSATILTGNSIYGGVISGGGSIFVNGGVLTLTGANTFSSAINLSVGTARVSSVANSGSGPLGTNNTIRLGATTSTSGALDYTGSSTTTSRTFDLAGGSGAGTTGFGTINNLGFGTLTLAGSITNTGASSTSTNRLTLTGDVVVNTAVADATGKTAIRANGGTGATTLQGNNTFTGGLSASNTGTLVVDYVNGGAVSSSNGVTFVNGGTLNLLASSGSGNTQTLGNLSFTDGINRVIANNTSLTLGTFSRTITVGAAILLDVSNGGSLTANTTGTTGTLFDNVIITSNSSTGYAGYILRTGANTYDFASATTTGAAQNIIALGANGNSGAFTTFIGTNGTANTINGRISSNGTTTTPGTAQTLGTLRVDTTAGAGGTLSVGSGGLTIAKNGLLFDGTGNYTVSGAGNLTVIGIYQYSTGTVTMSSGFTGIRLDKFGTGLLVNNSNSVYGSSGSLGLDLHEGVYRAGTANSLSAGRIVIGGGGILELAGSGNLTRAIGTGTNNVAFIGAGGFSAFGGDRSVSLGASVTWNSANFLGNGNKLILSSTTSDSTIDFQSGIDFNGVQREISVGNGTASVDAVISGNLTSNNYAGGGLRKTGAGTLSLTGTNTYTGATTINAGTLIVASTGSISSGSAVAVNNGGTLAGTGTVAGTVTVNSGGTLSPGNSPGSQTFGSLALLDGGNFNWQILDAAGPAGTGYDTYNLTGTLDLSGLTGANDFNINLWSLSSIGPDVNGNASNFDNTVNQSWTLVSTGNAIMGFDASEFNINVAAFNGAGGFSNALGGGTFSIALGDGNTDLVMNYTAIPEPSTWLLLTIGLSAVMIFRRRRRIA